MAGVVLEVLLLATLAAAAELKQKTIEGFERYVRATEARMARESADSFLWTDRLAQQQAEAHLLALRRGGVFIESLKTEEDDKRIEVPDGMVHHWVGIVFIPGATIEQTLAVLQDYDNHQKTYGPYVRRSKLIQRDGDTFQIYLQFYRKTFITAALNANFDVRWVPVDEARVTSRSYSTRIAEIENFGQRDEREKPVGTGRGFLWRLNTYGRLLEQDGGVYFQLESVALTRRVPTGWGWLINPLVRRVPRESLSLLLNGTKKAVRANIEPKPPEVSARLSRCEQSSLRDSILLRTYPALKRWARKRGAPPAPALSSPKSRLLAPLGLFPLQN